MLRRVCLAGLAYLLGGCSSPLQEYQCTSSAECTGGSGGRCEPSGHCSFVDDSCMDGFRFGEASGGESGECVLAEVAIDAGMDAPDAPPGPQNLWLRRQQLTINNMAHAEALINFPALVVLTPERIDYSKLQPEGQDLRFTEADGETLLAYEIETWDPLGQSLIWVKLSKIEASGDTESIYMYYDNVLAEAGENARGVWSNGYEAVYHLDETGDVFANSAGPGNMANNVGTTAMAGVIGGARLFDGTSAHIKLNNHAPMDLLQNASGITLTSWIKPLDLGAGQPNQSLIAVGSGDTCSTQSRATVLLGGGGALDDELVTAARSLDSDPQVARTTINVNLSADAWSLVSSVVDVDFEHNDDPAHPYGRYRTVVNETQHSLLLTARFAATMTDSTQTPCGTIGAQDDGSDDYFTGLIDEVRISRVDRSTIWLQAQYQSMQDDDFVRFGAREDTSASLGN